MKGYRCHKNRKNCLPSSGVSQAFRTENESFDAFVLEGGLPFLWLFAGCRSWSKHHHNRRSRPCRGWDVDGDKRAIDASPVTLTMIASFSLTVTCLQVCRIRECGDYGYEFESCRVRAKCEDKRERGYRPRTTEVRQVADVVTSLLSRMSAHKNKGPSTWGPITSSLGGQETLDLPCNYRTTSNHRI